LFCLYTTESGNKKKHPEVGCKDNFYSALALRITEMLATIAAPQSLLPSVQKINHWHMFKQTLELAQESFSTLDKYLSYFHLGHKEKEFIRRSKVHYFSEEKGKVVSLRESVY
jgi:hypothetical protein